MTADRRTGALLVAGGCLPFAAGALMAPPGEGSGTGLICPFRELTGLPCPLCGASRAFALAARGDGGLWRYNAVWVVLAVAAVVAGALVLAGRVPHLRPRPRLAWSAAVVVFVALPWVYALTQRATIVG